MANFALAARLGGCTSIFVRSCSVGTMVDLLAWVSTWRNQYHCSSNYDLVVLVEHIHGRSVNNML